MTPSAASVLGTAFATGVAGWVLENAAFGPRSSAVTPNLPFLPVYAVGGATIALLAPRFAKLSIPGQFFAYAATLTALEAVAGYTERTLGQMSWDYAGAPVDLPHAALWGVLGLSVGKLLTSPATKTP